MQYPAAISEMLEKRHQIIDEIALENKNYPQVAIQRIDEILRLNNDDRHLADQMIEEEQKLLSNNLNFDMHKVKAINLPALEKSDELKRIPTQVLGRSASSKTFETHDPLLSSNIPKRRLSIFKDPIQGKQFQSTNRTVMEMDESEESQDQSSIDRDLDKSSQSSYNSGIKVSPKKVQLNFNDQDSDVLKQTDPVRDILQTRPKKSKFSQPSDKFDDVEEDNPVIESPDQQQQNQPNPDVPEVQNEYVLMFKSWMLEYIHPSIKYQNFSLQLDQESSLPQLIEALLKSQTIKLVSIFFFLNHLIYSNLISMILPLSLFLYALLESPFPPKGYWNVMTSYLFIAIMLKMLYQLPIFCGDPSFTLVFSKNCKFQEIPISSFYNRLDIIIGIRKFHGPSSYPRDEGIFRALIWDYLALTSILIHRACYRDIGIWENVTLSEDKRLFPQLKNPEPEKNYHEPKKDQNGASSPDERRNAKIGVEQRFNSDAIIYNVENSSRLQKGTQLEQENQASHILKSQLEDDHSMVEGEFIKMSESGLRNRKRSTSLRGSRITNLKHEHRSENKIHQEMRFTMRIKLKRFHRWLSLLFKDIRHFWFRLFPYYLKGPTSIEYFENKDLHLLEKLQYEPMFIKPGRDMYTATFVLELIILIFFMVSYSSLNGDSISFKEGLTRSRFSGNLVIVIIMFILLLCLNRICFKLKYATFDSAQTSSGNTTQSDYSTPRGPVNDLSRHGKVLNFKNLAKRRLAEFEDEIGRHSRQGQDSSLDGSPTEDEREKKNKERVDQQIEMNRQYRKHALTLRFIIYILSVLIAHYYLFIMVPNYHKKQFRQLQEARVCYLIFLVYFYVSARQIYYGYADSVKIHAFTDNFNVYGKIGVRLFKAIPFLFEIKNVIDWSITTTTLDLFQWFKLEDAYITLFLTKAEMEYRKENKKFGEKMPVLDKLSFGWCFLLFLIFILIFPMMIFSTLNPNYLINNPVGGEFQLKLWTNISKGNVKDYKLFSTNQLIIQSLSKPEYDLLQKTYEGINPGTQSQFARLEITHYSEEIWLISPPLKDQLKLRLQGTSVFYLTFEWQINRVLPPEAESSIGSNTIILSRQDKQAILSMIASKTNTGQKLIVKNLCPKFLHLGITASSKYASYNNRLVNNEIETEISFEKTPEGDYWTMRHAGKNTQTIYTYNDLVIGQIFGSISLKNLSVITFYATVVLAIGRLIRGIFDQIIMKVIYEEMPYCEEIIEFCDSIYMARRNGDLVREQKLYELLIRMYRSPEILINLSKDYLYKDMEDTNNVFYDDHRKLRARPRAGSISSVGFMSPQRKSINVNREPSSFRKETQGLNKYL